MTIHYNIRNGGDGSAHLCWFSSAELASWDAENEYEPFGEDCSGSIEIFGENISTNIRDIQTPKGYFLNMLFNDTKSKIMVQFYRQFLLDGLGNFTITFEPVSNPNYHYAHIKLDDGYVHSEFSKINVTEQDIRNKILDKIRSIENS